MNVNEMFEIIRFAVAKNLQDGYVSPDDFNNKLMPVAQDGFLDYLLGEYQKYSPLHPIPPVGFSQNRRIRDSIAPLIYNITMPVNTTTGVASYPSDYEYVDNMWGLYGIYNIRFGQQDRLTAYVTSGIDPIASNPRYLLRNEGFEFYPHDIGWARMSYVRRPPPIHWGYTQVGDQEPVYDPTTSQDPVWSDSDCMQIIVRALALIGVNLQFPMVMQYASEIKNTGQ